MLFLGLDGYSLDMRLLYRRPDRPRIVPVVLVAGDETFDRLAWQELDLMTHRRQLPRPVLRAAASLHADQPRLPVGKVFEKLLALELQAHDLSALHVDPVQLEYSLGDIEAHYCFATIHSGPSGLPVKIFISSTLGTSMPSAREGPPLNPPPLQSYPPRRAPQVPLYRR